MEAISRRSFSKTVGAFLLFVATASAATLTGCNWLTDIENWAPVGLAAFNGIVKLLESAGIISAVAGNPIIAMIGVISAAFSQLEADIAAYKAIQPPPAGAAAKIQATLGIIVTNFQTMLASLDIQNGTLSALVIGLAQIIMSTIAGFQQQVPQVAPTVKITEIRLRNQVAAVAPHPRSIRQFKKDWNAVAHAGGHKEIAIHESLFERL